MFYKQGFRGICDPPLAKRGSIHQMLCDWNEKGEANEDYRCRNYPTKLPIREGSIGGYSNVIPAYATGGFYADGHGLRELAKEMEEYMGRGFKGVKMKVGRNSSLRGGFNPLRAMPERGVCEVSLEEDLERVKVVRETVGKDTLLMIDAN